MNPEMLKLRNKFENKKVLYVEDDRELSSSNEEALSLFCPNLYVAYDGTEGLEIYKENPDICLVLTDVTMHNMNGLEMSKKIREINKNVKIIARTSHSEEYLEEEFEEYNYKELFDKVLNKPFDFLDLLEIIDKYI